MRSSIKDNVQVSTLFILGALAFIQSVRSERPTVRIETKELKSNLIGERVEHSGIEVDQFLGIPYASESGNYDRFKKASSLSYLKKEVDCSRQPKACPQFTMSPYPWYVNDTSPEVQSEDCLYMNVWTPTDKTEKKAVMVWIHGGDFRYGSIRDEIYNGTQLAAIGNIIVITINYRLGFFSYFTRNDLLNFGNMGLFDITEALTFIKGHIEFFGGDPTRVTLAGQGSGATAIAFLALTKGSKKLFTRQILQSPLSLYRDEGRRDNTEYSFQLAEHFGCNIWKEGGGGIKKFDDKRSQRCMRVNVKFEEIRDYEFEMFPPRSSAYLVPQTRDGNLDPRQAVLESKYPCKDILIGINSVEGSVLLTAYEYQELFGFFGEKDAPIDRTQGMEMIRKVCEYERLLFPDEIAEHYLPEDLPDDKIRDQVVKAIGDITISCPAVYLATHCQKKYKNTYAYLFDHRPKGSPWAEWMGSTTRDEVGFVFGKPLREEPEDGQEADLSRDIIEYWAEFVRNGHAKSDWPTYDKGTYKILSPDMENGENGIHSEDCQFLQLYYGF